MANTPDTGMDLSSLLSSGIDDLVDIPGFEVPPVGQYTLKLVFEAKEINGKTNIEAAFTVVETMELKDPNDTPPLEGTRFSIIFQIANEFGLGNLKKLTKPIFEALGLANFGELLGQCGPAGSGVLITATVKHRKDKNDPEKIYAQVSNVEVIS